MVNGDAGLKIYSSTKTGLLYGTVTVEQILYQDSEHANVPKGVIRDYPAYEMRGVMFDIARIPTRISFLNDYTKIMKWYKLNEMQLHINDNQCQIRRILQNMRIVQIPRLLTDWNQNFFRLLQHKSPNL